MSVQARILPREEWHRVAHTEVGPLLPVLPLLASVVVLEHERVIVGCFTLVPLVHFETVWIDPAHRRKGAVLRRLLAALSNFAGGSRVQTGTDDAGVADILMRLGAHELPGRHFSLPVGV